MGSSFVRNYSNMQDILLNSKYQELLRAVLAVDPNAPPPLLLI
jgi:hypothetical protein